MAHTSRHAPRLSGGLQSSRVGPSVVDTPVEPDGRVGMLAVRLCIAVAHGCAQAHTQRFLYYSPQPAIRVRGVLATCRAASGCGARHEDIPVVEPRQRPGTPRLRRTAPGNASRRPLLVRDGARVHAQGHAVGPRHEHPRDDRGSGDGGERDRRGPPEDAPSSRRRSGRSGRTVTAHTSRPTSTPTACCLCCFHRVRPGAEVGPRSRSSTCTFTDSRGAAVQRTPTATPLAGPVNGLRQRPAGGVERFRDSCRNGTHRGVDWLCCNCRRQAEQLQRGTCSLANIT